MGYAGKPEFSAKPNLHEGQEGRLEPRRLPWAQGQGLIIAGCDEVGRGAFAFSLVVASCAYAPGVEMPFEIRDSKALTG
jgi:ribonuclease HIII